jgi:ketosteroid isomerase-like protein
MPDNREIVAKAFAAWANGTGYVTSLFADDMTWEIVGRSAASGKYASTSAASSVGDSK